jgi:hypothetical protein
VVSGQLSVVSCRFLTDDILPIFNERDGEILRG